jgi:hypothetical protein
MMVNFTPQADWVRVNATYKEPAQQAAASRALPAIREGEKMLRAVENIGGIH